MSANLDRSGGALTSPFSSTATTTLDPEVSFTKDEDGRKGYDYNHFVSIDSVDYDIGEDGKILKVAVNYHEGSLVGTPCSVPFTKGSFDINPKHTFSNIFLQAPPGRFRTQRPWHQQKIDEQVLTDTMRKATEEVLEKVHAPRSERGCQVTGTHHKTAFIDWKEAIQYNRAFSTRGASLQKAASNELQKTVSRCADLPLENRNFKWAINDISNAKTKGHNNAKFQITAKWIPPTEKEWQEWSKRSAGKSIRLEDSEAGDSLLALDAPLSKPAPLTLPSVDYEVPTNFTPEQSRMPPGSPSYDYGTPFGLPSEHLEVLPDFMSCPWLLPTEMDEDWNRTVDTLLSGSGDGL